MTIWAILPAAGIGRRMGSSIPKQYLPLNGLPVIVHSLRKLAKIRSIKKTLVVLHPEDRHWSTLEPADTGAVQVVTGGSERFQSVLNGLNTLQNEAVADDWVLVHDAVRPCVRIADIEKLIASLASHAVGGLLGTPIDDTLKQVNAQGEVDRTLDRADRWRALTPQLFRFGLLYTALNNVVTQVEQVTDEAMALEREGLRPQMVAGHKDNIKITHEADLLLAGKILDLQETV